MKDSTLVVLGNVILLATVTILTSALVYVLFDAISTSIRLGHMFNV